MPQEHQSSPEMESSPELHMEVAQSTLSRPGTKVEFATTKDTVFMALFPAPEELLNSLSKTVQIEDGTKTKFLTVQGRSK